VTSLPSNTAGPATREIQQGPRKALLRSGCSATALAQRSALPPPSLFLPGELPLQQGPRRARLRGAPLPHSHNALKATRHLNRFF
jgi:hypothetical protein